MTKFTIDGKQIDGKKEAPDWIRTGLTPAAIQYAEVFGAWLAGKGSDPLNRSERLTSSQFRNVFSEVIKFKNSFNGQKFLMLKPRLAYAMERKGTKGSKTFREVMEPAIDAVLSDSDTKQQEERFRRFADFFEAVLAYHRANGGE